MDGYVKPSILEPPLSDYSEPEESLTGSAVAKDRAASSLATKGPASKGQTKSADRRSGQLTVAVCENTCAHVAWRTTSFTPCLARLPRPSVLQAFGVEDRATTDKVKNFLLARPIGSGGARGLPAARPWSSPD